MIKEIKARKAHRAVALLAGLLYTMTPAMAQEPPGNNLVGEASGPLKALQQRVRDRQANLSPQERQGWDLLQRMVKADLTVPFIAREIRQNPNGKETELWVRWDPARGARLESIRPAGEIVVDNKTDAFVYNPRKHEWTQRGSLLLGVRRRSGDIARRLLQGTLKATWEGQDTIAGRTADIVRVAPANGAVGPARRLWIDRSNGLRLKSENVAQDGRVLNSSYYLSLDLSPTFRPDDFTVPQNATTVAKAQGIRFRSVAEAVQAGFAVRAPGYLPAGFTLRVVEVSDAGTPRQLITQRYFNGLSLISLAQTPLNAIPSGLLPGFGPNRSGFLPNPRGEGRAYVWRDANFSYALLGNLPEDEMKRIAESVR
jgi:hypothetical protein